MIIDRLDHSHLYKDLHPKFNRAFKYLKEAPLITMQPGKYDIEGDDIFLLLQEYQTKSEETQFWEAHNRYIDIQYMVQGSERMGYAFVEDLHQTEDFLAEKDYMVLEGKGQDLVVHEGAFAIFFPQDAHMPCLYDEQPTLIKKAVIKVKR
ncbi:YhcH/YjgK/YiaL family protein [Paenibacillus sp. GCM10023248]|uniref:YhcH/YjgK/YiaL family protein n=1 Tax=unclassified Paenibacillus TaxID=185978 RepID=UPI0023786BE2|nr:YhcH/YjgK/YiaL family protein [Paenibacillus sp. MAHUQ-63]MDD9269570.1 YhcH/YjgK/YiaL family protein [Paenibacillus sp. MAHUQ-63]